jgi:hypothetical protein
MKGFNFRMMLLAVAVAVGMAGAQTWDCSWTGSEYNGQEDWYHEGSATFSEGTLTFKGKDRFLPDKCGEDYTRLNRNFVTKVVIENGITEIASLDRLPNLTSVILPNSLISLGREGGGEEVFSGSAKLTSITFPNGVKSIAGFDGCTGLTSINIPNSVAFISGFKGCTGLTSITFLGSKSSIVINGQSITYSNGSVGYETFSGCTNLKSITLGNDVIGIGDKAFKNCTSLTSITIPNSVDRIGYSAFDSCTALTSVVIGNGVTEIGNGRLTAFNNCPAVKSLFVGNGLKTLGGLPSFSNYPQLEAVVIGTSVDSIPKKAFIRNSALTYASIGGGVIKDSAFTGLGNLTTLILGDSVKSIGTAAFSNLTNLTTLILGNNVKSIGESAFNGCTKLTTLTVPDNVKTIGASAFSGCPRLQTASIGNGADSIGVNAFRNCAGLTSVIIGNKVKSIGASAFSGCTGLASLTSLASDPPVVGVASGNGTFDGIDKTTCKLKVQQVDMGMYRNAAGWKDFANIEAVQFPNVPVMDITGVPASFRVGEVLALTGVVTPSTATNKTIEWSVAGASISGTNFTGAVIEGGNKLSAAAPGTVVVRAAIPSGAITGVDFERYFFITAESEEEEVTSVASRDRVIPSAVTAGVSAVAPVSRLSAGFAAGPNPVGALRATPVQFFYSGAAIRSAALYVYDASGNIVKRISVSDKSSAGVQSKRHVGSWDLKDKRGRPVSAGTYLVKGAVKTRDGKSEKVSAVVGVR